MQHSVDQRPDGTAARRLEGFGMQLTAVLDTVIGVSFVFFVLALAATAVAEWLSTVFKKRPKYLLRGLRDILDQPADGLAAAVSGAGPRVKASFLGAFDERALHEAAIHLLAGADQDTADRAGSNKRGTEKARAAAAGRGAARATADGVDAAQAASAGGGAGSWELTDGLAGFLAHPLVRAQATTSGRSVSRAPSYISGRIFADVTLDGLFSHGADPRSLADLRARLAAGPELPPVVQAELNAAARNAQSSIDEVRDELERWYDATMERVSGAYKRWVKRWLIVIAAAFVLVLHVDTLNLATTLYTDAGVREATAGLIQTSCTVPAASAAATGSSATGTARSGATRPTDAECLKQARQNLIAAGLPIGPPPRCSWDDPGSCLYGHADGADATAGSGFLAILGMLLSVLAVTFGAPFWFQLLTRASNLRNTGRPPEAARVPR
jgi:hypothetical protein